MPLRPQSIRRGELRDIAQLQRNRRVEIRPHQFVDERHDERRDDQKCEAPAEKPGLRIGLPTSDPDQQRRADGEYREHHQVRRAVRREFPLCRDQLDQLPGPSTMMAGDTRSYRDYERECRRASGSRACDLDLELLVFGPFVGDVADRTLADDPVALAFFRHLRLFDVPVAPYRECDVGKGDRQQ